MDVEIILVILFFVLSLIGGAAEKNKRKEGGAAPAPRGAQRLPDGGVLLPDGRVIAADAPEAEAFWWLPAPAASHEESSSEREDLEDGVISMEPVDGSEVRTLEPVGSATWDRGVREERPEPARPVLETAEVDWEAEHRRFHEKYVEGAQPRAAHARASLVAGIRGRHGLRQAVLAAEILGPPRALRPPDEH